MCQAVLDKSNAAAQELGRTTKVKPAAVHGGPVLEVQKNGSKLTALIYLVLLVAFLSSALALVPVLASPPSLTSMLEAFIL
jgi:hypothetical protein